VQFRDLKAVRVGICRQRFSVTGTDRRPWRRRILPREKTRPGEAHSHARQTEGPLFHADREAACRNGDSVRQLYRCEQLRSLADRPGKLHVKAAAAYVVDQGVCVKPTTELVNSAHVYREGTVHADTLAPVHAGISRFQTVSAMRLGDFGVHRDRSTC
jgi:hypothetical protein